MDEKTYQSLADATLAHIEKAMIDVDADLVDLERSGDVLTLRFASGKRCVLNTQRPTRQLWLACGSQAWHFVRQAEKWMDDKGRGDELHKTLCEIISRECGVDVEF